MIGHARMAGRRWRAARRAGRSGTVEQAYSNRRSALSALLDLWRSDGDPAPAASLHGLRTVRPVRVVRTTSSSTERRVHVRTAAAEGRRSPPLPVTLPGHLAGRPPRNKGLRYPLDPPTVEEIVAVMRQAVRCAGLDIGVHRSDRRSRAGKLSRQGSPQLRWALYESAQAACRPTSPDRADYLALARALARHSVADDRAQARPPLLPHPARTRPRSPRARHLNPPPICSATPTAPQMTASLPASSRNCRDSRPRAAVHQRPSSRSRPPRNDPSTITSPATRPSTQISPAPEERTAKPDCPTTTRRQP
jgi:hypothetical protein